MKESEGQHAVTQHTTGVDEATEAEAAKQEQTRRPNCRTKYKNTRVLPERLSLQHTNTERQGHSCCQLRANVLEHFDSVSVVKKCARGAVWTNHRRGCYTQLHSTPC